MPSNSFVAESSKVDFPVKTNVNVWLALIKIGVNEPLFFKENVFMYFRVIWVCENWEELELTGSTKVQVWPAENFFLLMCLTFLIYFWIKLFRETED